MNISNKAINHFTKSNLSPVELINPNGQSPIILICEHASNIIPPFLNELGLSVEDSTSHAAWDIGAYDLSCKLSELLDAQLISAKLSRLVYDCNRSPESGAGTPSKSEKIEIPGNKNLSDKDLQDRINFVYKPFHDQVTQAIDNSKSDTPIIITIHSFTPIYFDQKRSVELGILHDKDDRLAKLLMKEALTHTKLKSEFNSPYDVSDNVMHTINKHATESKLMNAMFEVKNDLLSTKPDIHSIAKDLERIIRESLKHI